MREENVGGLQGRVNVAVDKTVQSMRDKIVVLTEQKAGAMPSAQQRIGQQYKGE